MQVKDKSCNLFGKSNKTDPLHLGVSFGGIPSNLLINLIFCITLLVLFVLVRKEAFKYVTRCIWRKTSREARGVDNNLVDRLNRLFFSGNQSNVDSNISISSRIGRNNNKSASQVETTGSRGASGPVRETNGEAAADTQTGTPRQPTTPGEGDHLCTNDSDNVWLNSTAADENGLDVSQEQSQEKSKYSLTNVTEEVEEFWSWLIKVFTLTDEDMEHVAGMDAVQYLRFQRYILAFLAITTVVSIAIILPLNLQGTQHGNVTDFEHTTLSNLSPESPLLWCHITVAFLMFPLAIFMMRRFSVELKFRDPDLEVTRTLCIENIPVHMCDDSTMLRRHFAEAYPRIDLVDCKMAYDVAKLTELVEELEYVESCYNYGVRYKERHTNELSMYPRSCSRYCGCCCSPCTKKVKVVDYFEEKLSELRIEVAKSTQLALASPIGMAFITFKSLNDARKVFEDIDRSQWYEHKPPPQLSSISLSLRVSDWKVWFAPPPQDIYWEHLSVPRTFLFLKKVLANVCLFILTFFLTTPEFIVSQIDFVAYTVFGWNLKDKSTSGTAEFTHFTSTFLLWAFTTLLPFLVSKTDRWLGRWTRSEENHSIMRKTFWFLVLMVIVLPTFGLTTGMAYFAHLVHDEDKKLSWECVFLPDSGGFFVNYVITSALLGSSLELIRFPSMFNYVRQSCMSRTEAESTAIQKAITSEFRFGEKYARLLLVFAMVMVYSMSCPLITPFGFLYFLLKHFADRHNLIFVYARSKISRKVHATAIHFVIMSVAMLQVLMVAFCIVRNADHKISKARTKYAVFLFVITTNIFTAQTFSSFCRKISAIKFLDVLFMESAEDEVFQEYTPSVLKDAYDKEMKDVDLLTSPIPPNEQRYGSFDERIQMQHMDTQMES